MDEAIVRKVLDMYLSDPLVNAIIEHIKREQLEEEGMKADGNHGHG